MRFPGLKARKNDIKLSLRPESFLCGFSPLSGEDGSGRKLCTILCMFLQVVMTSSPSLDSAFIHVALAPTHPGNWDSCDDSVLTAASYGLGSEVKGKRLGCRRG